MSEVTRRLADAMLEYARKTHIDGACVSLVYVADDLARVAIEAMREPTKAMADAAYAAAIPETNPPCWPLAYQAMIDAALEPETPNE